MSEDIKSLLKQYFPAESFTDASVTTALQNGDIMETEKEILPYLQSALLDEKVLEVELDGIPRVYFTRIEDDPPPPDDSEDNSEDLPQSTDTDTEKEEEREYIPGTYLVDHLHLITLPLEPGLGNLHLRQSRIITLRMFTKAYAVEFGTTFLDLSKVGQIPVLKLAYPDVARIVRDAREYRAKVPESQDFLATIDIEEDEEFVVSVVNVSVQGMAFASTKKDYSRLFVDDNLTFKLYLDDELLLRITGTIKHRSKIRKDQTIEYTCGVAFDLGSRTTSAVVESIVARVQRAHLKELADLSDKSGIDLIA